MKKFGTILAVAAFILWLFFVLISFYAVQKPFELSFAAALIRIILDLLIVGWLALIALGLGVWALRWISPTLTQDVPETLLFSLSLGLGLLALLSFGVGLVGLFSPLITYGITLLLTIFVVPRLWLLLRQMQRWRRKASFDRFHPLARIYLGVIGLFTLLLALLPPTDFDGLFYHLTAPKVYIQAGQIVAGFNVPHFSFPALMEMLFAWAMLLRGDIAAKLIHTLFVFLLAGLIYQMASTFFNKKIAQFALLIFASMPLISTLGGWAYNDLALAFYQLATVYAFLKWTLKIRDWRLEIEGDSGETNVSSEIVNRQSKIVNHPWLLLSGLCAGLAMGLKYTSVVTPVLITFLIIGTTIYVLRPTSYEPQSTTTKSPITNYYLLIIPLLTFTLAALLIAAPWYLKNWAFTGNPVYPFLHSVFGGLWWDDFRATWYSAAGTGILSNPIDFSNLMSEFSGVGPANQLTDAANNGSLFLTLLSLPWLLTLGIRDTNFWDGRTGPLLLLFLPAVIGYSLSRRARAPYAIALGVLTIYTLAQYGFWTLGVLWSKSLWQSRLLLAGLVGFVPLAGWAWQQLSQLELSTFSLRRFLNITISLILLLTLLDTSLLFLTIKPLPYLTGMESRDEYLIRRLGAHYALMQEIDETLPDEARIVFLWEPRAYYCPRDCRPDSILDTLPHLIKQYHSAEAIVQYWQASGVTHILIHRSGVKALLASEPEAVDEIILSELEANYFERVIDVIGAYQVYALPEVE